MIKVNFKLNNFDNLYILYEANKRLMSLIRRFQVTRSNPTQDVTIYGDLQGFQVVYFSLADNLCK